MRSGTTSLSQYLKAQPQIFINKKETNFLAIVDENLPEEVKVKGFLTNSLFTWESYANNFKDADIQQIAIGEASPLYLYKAGTAEKIRKYFPSIKIIVILRNPLDQVYSHFCHNIRKGHEFCNDFTIALDQQNKRIKDGQWTWWKDGLIPYIEGAMYYKQLRRYFEVFDHDQIKVVLYDDLTEDPQKLCQDLSSFLGVSLFEKKGDEFYREYNKGGVAKNMAIEKLLFKVWKLPPSIKKLFRRASPDYLYSFLYNARIKNLKQNETIYPYQTETRENLKRIFKDDISCLESLVSRDLSHWLQ